MKCFVLFTLSAKSHVLRVLPRLRGCWLFACYFTSEGFGTMGKCIFSKLWLQKSVYKEWLREVKGDKHKAQGTMHGVHEGCWHFKHGRVRAHKSLERKKNIKQWHPRKGHYQASQICFGISSQRPATTSDDAKVVSKSASSESGKHTKLNSRKSFTASSSVMEKCHLWWDVEGRNFMGNESNYVSLHL